MKRPIDITLTRWRVECKRCGHTYTQEYAACDGCPRCDDLDDDELAERLAEAVDDYESR